ncbi:MAG: DapH/DapD/GlmU-related protein [Agrobacterium cavarae]|jgi:acetyltransferase-like isoleucine patch superfamily enzyme|uniref:Acyltransferase n=1 Tax=Agrobacterium cavarae TaxID=2528239 RepID=A0ABY1Y5G0_9HYPH|nr:acyltransferase [Agrobacterium cavarae]KQM31048.1 acetyltransferase [Rhizobium sp. Leaf202]KQN81726.1 acetyltransferase [Rhizobium sp. Leaf68]TBN10898.1 acyltransferase [Agrobacterium cavarae]
MIEIHPSAKISDLCDIEDSTRGTRIIIGENCVVDSFVKIKPAGGNGDVVIGSSSYINSGCVLYSGSGITIGNNVLIAANCTLAPVNHDFRDPDRLIREQGFLPSKGGIRVENDVWIGANSVILDGAYLREGCIIGAGSIVRGEVPSYAIMGGNPLKILGSRK